MKVTIMHLVVEGNGLTAKRVINVKSNANTQDVKDILENPGDREFYKIVAVIDYPSYYDQDAFLEDMFELTQNIDTPWIQRVKDAGWLAGDYDLCRSTSVGDIIMLDDDKYIVKPIGFEKI